MLSKKIIPFAASVLMVFSTACPAFAASSVHSPQSTLIQPSYVNINLAATSLSISSDRTATITGYVQRTPYGEEVYLKCTLERYADWGDYWYPIKSWSTSSTWYSASISKNYNVASGTYRVATYYSVTGAGGTESNVVYSKVVSC